MVASALALGATPSAPPSLDPPPNRPAAAPIASTGTSSTAAAARAARRVTGQLPALALCVGSPERVPSRTWPRRARQGPIQELPWVVGVGVWWGCDAAQV